MKENQIKIKEGIKLHMIETNLFKTNMAYVTLSIPLKRETVTKAALLPFLLKQGSKNYKTQIEINKKLEAMYGAECDFNIEKIGDNQVIEFYINLIQDKYALNNEELLGDAVEALFDIVFNPYIEDGKFNEEYLKVEKENLKKLITSKIDNKGRYSLDRCTEIMYGKEGYGLYKYGYIDDVEEISNEDMVSFYNELVNSAKIDVYVSGMYDKGKIQKLVINGLNDLNDRKGEIVINSDVRDISDPKEVVETMDISQGKLAIGVDVKAKTLKEENSLTLLNVILGGTPSSLLFINVREKASLAYSTRSNFNRTKNVIFITAGIENDKYEMALDIIKKQLDIIKHDEYSDEDIENAKTYLFSSIDMIELDQDAEISYYINQEYLTEKQSIDEYKEAIKNISRDDIKDVSKDANVNTIFFLRG